MYGTAIKQGGTADIVYSSLAETDGVSARFFIPVGSRTDFVEAMRPNRQRAAEATQPKAGG